MHEPPGGRAIRSTMLAMPAIKAKKLAAAERMPREGKQMFKKNQMMQETALGIAAIIFMAVLVVMDYLSTRAEAREKKHSK